MPSQHPRRFDAVTFDRRALLRAMGISSGSLFLPSLLGDKAARAASPGKRVFILLTEHGPTYETWRVQFPGGSTSTTVDWEQPLANADQSLFNTVLKPLYAIRNDITVLDGIANVSALAGEQVNCHNMGNSNILASKMVVTAGDGSGGGPSVDQLIGKAVATDAQTKSMFWQTWGTWSPVFSGSGQSVNGDIEPGIAFNRIFGSMNPAMSTPGTGADPLAVARSKLLSDVVSQDYAALMPKLSKADADKVSAHRDLINDLQKQLVAKSSGSMASCTQPANPGPVAEVLDSGDKFLKLAVGVFACNLTPAIVLRIGQPPPTAFGAPAGLDVHQDIAHQAFPGTQQATYMAQMYGVHAQQFANFVSMMKAIPEGNGTMLDNSVVLWVTEIGDGPHDLNRLFMVMAGSCGGYFKTGRYLKYAETGPTFGGAKSGPGHTHVLVSLMQAMGMTDNSIGNTSAGGVDLTGPLPRLTG